jgi:hypothetical protein
LATGFSENGFALDFLRLKHDIPASIPLTFPNHRLRLSKKAV